MASSNFVASLVAGVLDTVQPLTNALQSVQGLAALLSQFGWGLDDNKAEGAYGSAFAAVQSEISALAAFASSPTEDSFLSVLTPLVNEVNNLKGHFSAVSFYPFTDPTFQQTFAAEIVDYLVYEYLRVNLPRVFGTLSILKLIDAVRVPASVIRGAYLHRTVAWDSISSVLGNPAQVFSTKGPFSWGTSDFDTEGLVRSFYAGFSAFGFPVIAREPEFSIASDYYGSLTQAQSNRVAEVLVPLYRYLDCAGGDQELLSVSLGVMPIPPIGNSSGKPDGIVLYLDARGDLAETFPINSVLTGFLEGQFSNTGGLRAELHPDSSRVTAPRLTDGTAVSANFGLALAAPSGTPFLLIGTPGSNRIQLQSAKLTFGAIGELGSASPGNSPAEFTIHLAADQLAVYVDFGESDGLLQSLLGSSPQSVQGSFGITWSSLKGFSFNGQAQLTATIPLRLSLAGAVDIDTATIALAFTDGFPQPGQDSLSLNIGLTGGFDLGPISATVQDIGVSLTLTDSATPRTPGEVRSPDIAFKFKTPTGLGLAIDAGIVSGGGFVSFDEPRGQYSGLLELALETLSLTATGLIQTKNADGTPFTRGYSLLVIIAFKFLPPVELGFGFSLNGVGGLLGLNRTTNVDAMRGGVRSGSVQGIMFPTDPVGHAPQLIQALQGFFPAAPDRFLIGPFVEIEWGSPRPILTAQLGVLVELPAPIRIVILGVLSIGLPQVDDDLRAIVQFNLDSLGVLDFGQGTLSLDASLYDLKVAEFMISGDMALRLGGRQTRSF